MERKILDAAFDLRALADNGRFEGYASVFDEIDSVRDRVASGAFADTLRAHRRKGRLPPMLWQHDAREPIGVWREMFEDKRGLFVRGELFVNDIPRARQAYKLMQEKAISGLSIGFRVLESDLDPKTGSRTLTKIDLMEVSMVTFPALENARVSSVKNALSSGIVPGEREVEAFLRDAGFSRQQAKGFIASGYKAVAQRDAVENGHDEIEAVRLLTEKIRRLTHR